MSTSIHPQLVSQEVEIDHIFLVVFQQRSKGVGIAVVDVIPPEPDRHQAIYLGQLSLDTQPCFDDFQTSFELLPPTVIHQIGMAETRLEVQAQPAP